MIRRRGSSPAAALEDDDMLGEILLRLPPRPSSLPRASAVCKRWRGLITDHGFHRRFYAHHHKPPLLGVLVCDPITGDRRHVPIPPEFRVGYVKGTVLCAAHDKGHVHGACHSTPFKVVLLVMCHNDSPPLASVYSSESDTWGDIFSAKAPCPIYSGGRLSTLVGNAFYWPLMHANDGILEFDLDRQSLDVLEGPPGTDIPLGHQIIPAKDGTIGIAMLSRHYHDIQMWPRKTIGTHSIPELPPQIEGEKPWVKFILGYDEDTDGIILYVKHNVYMVQLKSMQCRRLFGSWNVTHYHCFKSFYAPGVSM
ncbi:hypothetical protein VPH35_126908 [Triticum aestivum]